MESTLLDELMKVPSDAIAVTVYGVQMQMIDAAQAQKMLDADPDDESVHECLLANGRFLCEFANGKLINLYKVKR